MRILVFGGTVFLSAATAQLALARGHEVTVASRGRSGAPPAGARVVELDRAAPIPPALAAEEFDAVIDVGRAPSWVRRAADIWTHAHWTFVSTISVYADDATPGGGPGTLALHPAEHDDLDLAEHPEAYGPMKLGCEEIVLALERSTVVRPGLIVGPGDPSGRLTYWVERLAAAAPGEQVLTSGRTAPVQVVDVRDLAAMLVHAAEHDLRGVVDAVGPVMPLGGLLDRVAIGVGVDPASLIWCELADAELEAADVAPWMGPRSLPLWLPRPE